MSSSTILLDVGGHCMKTHKSTLEKLDFFKSYLARWNGSEKELFIDYDPTLFIHLLNKLRDDNYVMPDNENITQMLDYFGYVAVESVVINEPINNIYEIHSNSGYKISYELSNEKIILFGLLSINEICKIIIKTNDNRLDITIFNKDIPFFFKKSNDVYTLKKNYLKLINNFNMQAYIRIDIEASDYNYQHVSSAVYILVQKINNI